MVTALQIALLLILIALIGIILGYIFGRLACKKRESSLYFEKSDYCEEQYTQNLIKDELSGSANSTFNNDFATVARESESSRVDAAVATDSGGNSQAQSLLGGDGAVSGDIATEQNSQDLAISQALTEEKEGSVHLGKASSDTAKQEDQTSNESGAAQEQDANNTQEGSSSTQVDKSEANEKSSANESVEAVDENEVTQEQATDIAHNDAAKQEDQTSNESGAAQEQDANNTQEGSSSTQVDKSEANEKSSANESVEAVDEGVKPPVLSEPKNGTKDNLCRIKGIGNIIEGKLNDLGIFHFEQIAAWSEDEVKWIDSHLAFSGRILREDWIGQAKLLATGEETEFSKRVDKGEVATSKID